MNAWLAAKNILTLRTMDTIGDAAMLRPTLGALKETSPQAHLTLLTNSQGVN